MLIKLQTARCNDRDNRKQYLHMSISLRARVTIRVERSVFEKEVLPREI